MKSLVILFFIFILFSCGNLIETSEEKLPQKYSYVITNVCDCLVGPFSITIDNGVITEFVYSGNEDLIHHPLYFSPESKDKLLLPNLLARVGAVLAENPYKKSIKYHPIYKFAYDVYFDISQNIIDEEWGYVISEFREL